MAIISQYLFVLTFAVVFLCQYISHAAVDTFDSDGFEARELKLHLSWGIGQSLDTVEFKSRGTITVRNFKGPKYAAQQDKLTIEELKNIEIVAKEDGYYFISVGIKFPNGEKTFHSFVPAKSFLDSGLSDVINVHLNPSGEIFSISYSMACSNFLSPQLQPDGKSKTREMPLQYNTTLLVQNGENAIGPDTGPYLEKLEMERLARERGEDSRDNRSFIAKYWMYIVPVALLVLLSGASNPEGGS